MTLKLPRTIRLDPSDTLVFDHAAEPGEWAITGSFLFFDTDPTDLAGSTGKRRAAFRSGFVGVRSLGFSTLVVVTEADDRERDLAIEMLAGHIHHAFGAPDRAAAQAAAREEVAFAASLCDHDPNTIIAMHRTLEEGEIREQFRTLRPRDAASPGADRLHAHARAFEFVETDPFVETDAEPGEEVDLVNLMRTTRP